MAPTCVGRGGENVASLKERGSLEAVSREEVLTYIPEGCRTLSKRGAETEDKEQET